MDNVLATDIALCIIAAWVVAVISQLARLPLLLAYLAAGFTFVAMGSDAGVLASATAKLAATGREYITQLNLTERQEH